MKSCHFIQLTISLILLNTGGRAAACGPYLPTIPTPDFLAVDYMKSISDREREENLHLWQSLTDKRIPLDHIEQAVYKDSENEFQQVMWGDHNPSNLFYTYLYNSDDAEIISFLSTAKELETRWGKTTSAWYYPSDRNTSWETGDYSDIIERCEKYPGTRLKDRYALQATRAIFASRSYGDCIEYYDSAFAEIPASNLFKRMAGRYVAGCWERLGETNRADSLFALAGDITSINSERRVEIMTRLNPSSPQLTEYIRWLAGDTAFMKSFVPVARKLIADKRVTNKGDWNFTIAYTLNEYEDSPAQARAYIYNALRGNFSSQEMHDLARVYKMKLDAKAGDRSSLLADLKWMTTLTDNLNPDAHEWERRLKNIIYSDWVPQLWVRKDYATAILLCAYADGPGPDDFVNYYDYDAYCFHLIKLSDLRKDEYRENYDDYGSLSFQMMGSLSSSQLAATYNRMMASTPLYNFLRTRVRTDADYYNELIGTLALREENYPRAIAYLSRVSSRYERTTNIFKGGYLSRDPFLTYPTRWKKYKWDGGDEWECDYSVSTSETLTRPDAKLNFARRMADYSREMKHAADPDRRAMARLMYAIGRRNSFEECWALTQYWRGFIELFKPSLEDYDSDSPKVDYRFLYDYDSTVGHEKTEEIYDREVAAALAMMTSDETRARAEYLLGNLRTVIKRYPSTGTAATIRASCDNWRDWL